MIKYARQASVRASDILSRARDRSRDSEVLVLRLCDSLVLWLLGIDFEMVKR